jgi:hypothetical protein
MMLWFLCLARNSAIINSETSSALGTLPLQFEARLLRSFECNS